MTFAEMGFETLICYSIQEGAVSSPIPRKGMETHHLNPGKTQVPRFGVSSPIPRKGMETL